MVSNLRITVDNNLRDFIASEELIRSVNLSMERGKGKLFRAKHDYLYGLLYNGERRYIDHINPLELEDALGLDHFEKESLGRLGECIGRDNT